MNDLLQTLALVGFNWHIALANLINLVVIFVLLKKFVFSKIGQVVTDREVIIEKGLEDAEAAALALRDAERASSDIISTAQKSASQLKLSAEEESRALEQRTKSELEEAKAKHALSLEEKSKGLEEKVRLEFERGAKKLVADLVVKSLSQDIDNKNNSSYIVNSLSK